MSYKTDSFLTPVVGFATSFLASMHLYQDIAIKGGLAILTGFLGGAAAMLGKAFVQWLINKIKK